MEYIGRQVEEKAPPLQKDAPWVLPWPDQNTSHYTIHIAGAPKRSKPYAKKKAAD